MKAIRLLLPLLPALLGMLLPTSTAHAQAGAAVRLAAEVGEALAKRAGSTAARELTELGGEVAVREILQEAEKEGGEQLVKKLAVWTGEHGAVALQAAKGAPRIVGEAVEKLPKELVENGLRAIAKEPVVMQKLIRETGQEALEAAAKHPGIGGQIASKLGKEGAEVAAKASENAALGLARHADDIAKLGAAERSGFLSMMKSAPEKCLKFLGKHPVGTLTAAAVISFLANPDAYLGSDGKPGLIERLIKEPVRMISMTLAGLLAVWGLMKILLSARHATKNRTTV